MPWSFTRACLYILIYLTIDRKPESTVFDYFRVRQKVSALCNQAKEDLEESRAAVRVIRERRPVSLGEKGLAELGVCHSRLQQGQGQGGREGSHP